MANREELLIIRAARAGKAPAQLALGKRYLFGGGGLPQSHSTALHWLQKAAENNQPDAWLLIGANVPFDVAHQVKDPLRVAFWYERAFDGGIAKAGLVLALLVFSCWTRAEPSLKQKALRALQAAAEAGLPDAQWLLAQQLGIRETARQTKPHDATASEGNQLNAAVEWATRAAKGGVIEAQYVLADSAWEAGDYLKFLLWALPLAQDIERRASGITIRRQPSNKLETELLSRCAQALLMTSDPNSRLIEHYLRVAAEGGQSSAQLAYGLWIARMDENGLRLSNVTGVAHYKKAIRWLTIAAEQGEEKASFALSRVFLKPEFSRRSVAEARRYLEMAASGGHMRSQLEMGLIAWRQRRIDPRTDIRAVYWLLKAAAQGNEEAQKLLHKIVPPIRKADWASIAKRAFTREMMSQYPFLAARVELGYWFGLTRAEALLIDVQEADHGHCLEIDIREEHPRSRRRLILILTSEQRQAVDYAARVFDTVDGSPTCAEGNYRQRIYRFRSLMSSRREHNRNRA
jgi:uncharacterized protein